MLEPAAPEPRRDRAGSLVVGAVDLEPALALRHGSQPEHPGRDSLIVARDQPHPQVKFEVLVAGDRVGFDPQEFPGLAAVGADRPRASRRQALGQRYPGVLPGETGRRTAVRELPLHDLAEFIVADA